MAAIMEEPPSAVGLVCVSVGLAEFEFEVVACWDSSSMTQALDGGSIVGRPMRAWRAEAMWRSVKRRM